MSTAARQYFELRAQQLSDCADLQFSTFGERGELLEIVPRNSSSIGVYILVDTESNEFQVGFDHEHDVPYEFARNPRDIDDLLDPAVDGRVRVLVGPARGSILIRNGEEFETFGSHYHWRALLPIPGWRRRARVVDFAPYRTTELKETHQD